MVVGDLVLIGPGDQVIADGEILPQTDFQIDESNLTGESEPVRREAGGEVWSGSFAVEGEAGSSRPRSGPGLPRRQAGRDRLRLPPPAPRWSGRWTGC